MTKGRINIDPKIFLFDVEKINTFSLLIALKKLLEVIAFHEQHAPHIGVSGSVEEVQECLEYFKDSYANR